MNDATHAVFSEYIKDIAEKILLGDWEIVLSRDRAGNDCHAFVEIPQEENLAYIYLHHPDVFGHPPEDLREWIVHELLHLHLDRVDRLVRNLANQFPDNSATQYVKEAHHNEIEVSVQRLARILAPMLPLPPKAS